MNELHQRPAVTCLLQHAPIGVVAQIAAGIARQPRRNGARAHRAEQAGERRCAAQRRRLARGDHAALRTVAARVGKQERDGVARPCLDAEVVPAPGKAEHQDDVRPRVPEFCQLAIDSRVSGREYVGRPHDFSEGRPPPAGERFYQERARIERHAGEGAEADQQHAHRVTVRGCRRSCRRRRQAQACRQRPRLRSRRAPP
jgi:hypothetical protein